MAIALVAELREAFWDGLVGYRVMSRASSSGVAEAQRRIAVETDKAVADLIATRKIHAPAFWRTRRGRLALLLGALVLTGIGSVLYQWWVTTRPASSNLPNGAQLGTALVAAIAAGFAYYQWTDARREASIDKFYDRLSLVNERYYAWLHARALVDHFWAGTDEPAFQRAMYVYVELDNLEYMITRYQLGYVPDALLRRAARTFKSRCQSAGFAGLAAELVSGAGYQEVTGDVVSFLTDLPVARSSAKLNS